MKITIIVVEDEIRIREGIGRLLRKLDGAYEVIGEAQNGREGLQMIREYRPDLIITDIRMPEMDGLEMLRALKEEGIAARAIVLSAYSEFEYARQAIKLGVKEYLLKPIVLNDFAVALQHVKEQMQEDGMRQPEQMGTLERVFGGILSGNIVADRELLSYVWSKYHIREEQNIAVLTLYLGRKYGADFMAVKRRMQDMLAGVSGTLYSMLEMPQRKSLLLLFYEYRDAEKLERWLQYQVLGAAGHQPGPAAGWVVADSLRTLREAFQRLYPYMDWNIALGGGIVISYPKITKVQTAACVYPVELENRMKAAVCAFDAGQLMAIADRFHACFQDGRVYEPKEMKECYVRFLWAVIDIGKEVGRLNYESLEQQKLLESVMDARTREELKESVDFLLELLSQQREGEQEISHLTVKRALSMIREFYGCGITLDEIAGKLNITPEYLGTQFHREMGVNFSTYIKNYRMQKAKELLIGTRLKLYEIAGQVGYSDAKYFSRVFRESTGQLPLDYRKTHL